MHGSAPGRVERMVHVINLISTIGAVPPPKPPQRRSRLRTPSASLSSPYSPPSSSATSSASRSPSTSSTRSIPQSRPSLYNATTSTDSPPAGAIPSRCTSKNPAPTHANTGYASAGELHRWGRCVRQIHGPLFDASGTPARRSGRGRCRSGSPRCRMRPRRTDRRTGRASRTIRRSSSRSFRILRSRGT